MICLYVHTNYKIPVHSNNLFLSFHLITGECRYDSSMKAVSASRCTIYEPDYNHDLELYDLMARFSDRPHAISVAATPSFGRYQSGIFDEECEGQSNHAVVNVG